MANKPNDNSGFIENCLSECLAEFKSVTEGIDKKSEEWLLKRFRTNFVNTFGDIPEGQWKATCRWLKKQTKAMAHYAVATAIVNDRAIPTVADLKTSVEHIQKHPQCQGPIVRGRFCI